MRVVLSLAAAAAVAALAWRAGSLTRGGAVVAALIGAAAMFAGLGWIVLLLVFFVTSTWLTRWRAQARNALLAGIVEKGGARDAVQVLANGAVFALAAIGSSLGPSVGWLALGAGAIAAAAADTWSTEIGTAVGRTPRHILSGAPMSTGLSGGITLAGSVGAVAAAVVVAITTFAVHWAVSPLAVVAGGVTGAFVDSLLGATVQERRWCDRCGRLTERRVHSCGTPTRVCGGLAGFANDAVNLTSVLVGAVITRVLS